jgi:hypothetical protein
MEKTLEQVEVYEHQYLEEPATYIPDTQYEGDMF